MKKLILLFLLAVVTALSTNAQIGGGYDSAINFGGAGASVLNLEYDNQGNIYFVAGILGKAVFAGQQLDGGVYYGYPQTKYIYGKIAPNGTQTLLSTFSSNYTGYVKSAINKNGEMYALVIGSPFLISDFGNGIIADTYGLKMVKFSNTGVAQWIKPINTGSNVVYGSTGSASPNVPGMKCTPNGDLYMVIDANNPSSNPPNATFKYPHRIAKYTSDGNEVWHTDVYSEVLLSTLSVPQQFVTDDGKITFGIYSNTNRWYYNGEDISTQLSNYANGGYAIIISLKADGSKNFTIADGSYPALLSGVNPLNGNLYVSYGAGPTNTLPSKAPFNTLPNLYPVSQYLNLYMFSGLLKFDSSGNYLGYNLTKDFKFDKLLCNANGFVTYEAGYSNAPYTNGDYVFNSTVPYGIIAFYDLNYNLLKAIKVPKTETFQAKDNKVIIGGSFKGTLNFGATTLTQSFNDTDFETRFPKFASIKTDIFIASADAANVSPPTPVNWLGVDNNWNNTANWSSGLVPDVTTIIRFNSTTANMPFVATTPTALKVIIDAGVTATLPAALVIKNKLIINGTLQINHTGALNFTNYSATAIEGTGTLAFNGTSSPSVSAGNLIGFKDLSLTTNENISLSSGIFKNITFTGTNSIISSITGIEITNSDVNAISGQSTTNYFTGKITRAVNSTGVYVFPNRQSSFAPLEPTTITLNNLLGTTKITVANDNGATNPNLNFATGTCTTQLGQYYWRITADVVPTSGTYNVSFQKSAFTNGVTDANRYVVLKRIANGNPWNFEGTKTASTQTGGTTSGTAPNEKVTNATVIAGLTGLTKFSDFTIGINSTAVPTNTSVVTSTWTGANNTEWNNAGNWSAGIPNGTIDAVIPSGLTNYPLDFTEGGNAKSLTVNAGVNSKLDLGLILTNGLINNGVLEIIDLRNNNYIKLFTVYAGGITGTGKLVFKTLQSVTGGVINNDIEIDAGTDFSNNLINEINIIGKVGGNINILSGAVRAWDFGGQFLESTNPDATITIASTDYHIAGRVLKSVNANGTYFLPLGDQQYHRLGTRKYGAITIKNNNLNGPAIYNVYFNSYWVEPVSIVDGASPISGFLNSGQWRIDPDVVSNTGTVDLLLETKNYTNGRTDVSDYVFLRRDATLAKWLPVSGATITELNGKVTVTANGLAPFTATSMFCIGLKAKTTQWTGTTSTDWNTASNWNNGIPDQSIKAQIIAGSPRYPVLAYGNNAALLEIGAGVNMKLPLDFDAKLGVVNNGTIEVEGTGTFNGFNYNQSPLSGTGKLLFTNNSPENISGSYMTGQKINNGLEVNKTGGVKTSYNMVIGGDLNLVNGLVTTSGELIMSNPDAILTATAQSYIVGILNRKVNANGTYSFPVGSATAYSPVSLTLNSIVGVQNLKAGFNATANTTAPVISVNGRIIDKTLDNGVWTIEPEYGQKPTAGTYDVSLQTSNYTNGVTNADLYNIIKRAYSFFPWEFLGNTPAATQTGGTINGVVLANGLINATIKGLTGFSEFAIGIRQEGVLPITLVSFKANKVNTGIKLNWLTAAEKNSAYFEVQKSTDGITFTTIGKIDAAGNSTDNKYYSLTDFIPVKGINYYRLNQVDLDGKAVLSYPVAINFDLADVKITVYPNPAINELHFTGLKTGATVTLFNIEGKKVLNQKIENNTLQLPTFVKSGLYIMNIKANDGSETTLKVSITK